MRYYDTETHTETSKESLTTIPMTDDRVKGFFQPLPKGHRLTIVNNLPVIEPIPQPTAEEVAAREKTEANQVILQELEEIDRLSIRDIREWIANQPSAPQLLKDREAQAILKRGQLQP